MIKGVVKYIQRLGSNMPIHVNWNDEAKQVIRVDYEGKWEWDEFFDANKQTQALMGGVDHRVDVIADMKNGHMPTTGASFTFAKNSFRTLPANWGVMVIVTSLFIGKLVDVFKQLDRQFGSKLYTASTVEQAHDIIQKQRAKTK